MKDRLNALLEESIKIHYCETSCINNLLNIKRDLETKNNPDIKTIEESYNKLESVIKTSEDFENKRYILRMIENDKKTLEEKQESVIRKDILFFLFRNNYWQSRHCPIC